MKDECFIRGHIPMTKSEVRAVVLSKLELTPDAVFWDIGAGTGSVSVEAALWLWQTGGNGGKVYAVEKEAEGIALIRENKERLAPDFRNFYPVHQEAPEAFLKLPPPSHVLVGGSGGRMGEILQEVFKKNPKARVVITAVTAETFASSIEIIRDGGFSDYEIVQIQVSRMEKRGKYHLQKAQNPVFVITIQGNP